MLKVDNITVRYGGLTALRDVTLELDEGGFVALVGANGAGKSSLFKALLGTAPLAAGRIMFDGRDLAGLQTHERARLGIGHVPEGRHVFKNMSVSKNLMCGFFAASRTVDRQRSLDFVFSLFPRLAERREQLAGTLSGGEQQMVAIGRALTGNPRLLLLDEPSMGLAPAIVDEIFACIGRLHDEQSMSVLLVEQRVGEALELCDRAYVLQSGVVTAEGAAEELTRMGHISRAYSGGLE
ncbi:MAG: ABC transporter ATP-binding protein [Aquamicrobium sp.]|uniref:ABC transporter ATP-binding protein n=1 Tax=Aquamicrobium sp. TaxID=1872579 RepID=UPI00349E59E5|nr:ABC transporter ATP-binding protein [Aquamicrobium sp.]